MLLFEHWTGRRVFLAGSSNEQQLQQTVSKARFLNYVEKLTFQKVDWKRAKQQMCQFCVVVVGQLTGQTNIESRLNSRKLKALTHTTSLTLFKVSFGHLLSLLNVICKFCVSIQVESICLPCQNNTLSMFVCQFNRVELESDLIQQQEVNDFTFIKWIHSRLFLSRSSTLWVGWRRTIVSISDQFQFMPLLELPLNMNLSPKCDLFAHKDDVNKSQFTFSHLTMIGFHTTNWS